MEMNMAKFSEKLHELVEMGKKKKNGGENVRESQNHLNSTTDNDGHISGKSTTDKLDNISLSVSPTGLAFAMKL